MTSKFKALKNFLISGISEEGCFGCTCDEDTLIVRGSTEVQSFNIPLDLKFIKDITISYRQKGFLIVRKYLADLEQTGDILHFVLTEEDTLRFKNGIEVEVQLKITLNDGDIVYSDKMHLNVDDSLDTLRASKDSIAVEAEIDGQKVCAISHIRMISGSENIYKCRLYFDESWDDFEKTIIFKDEYNNIAEVVSNSTEDVVIPSSVLKEPGKLYIAIKGDAANKVRPTEWSNALAVSLGLQ